MSPLDRALQRKMLLAMQAIYPDTLRAVPDDWDEAKFDANLIYLDEHGLCESGLSPNMTGGYGWGGSKITARGLDFLEDDGGLSAILGVVTIKFHADTLRDLLIAKAEASALPPQEKSVLKQRLAQLSETGMREAATELVRSGLHHLPDAVGWLRTLAGL